MLVAAAIDCVVITPQVDEPIEDPMFLDDATKGDVKYAPFL